MKRILTVFVTVAFSTTFLGNSIMGFEDCAYNEEQAKGTNPLVIGAEGVGALGVGAVVGYGSLIATVYGLGALIQPTGLGETIGIVVGGVAAGYGLGFPLGSAMGASAVGGLAEQGGSFWGSCCGAELGAIAAAGLAWALWEVTDVGALPVLVLALGPPTGAVIGYKLIRPNMNACSFPFPPSASSNESVHSSPQLSLLVPEVELRRDRVSNTFRKPTRGSPTFTYKLTLARLSF